MTHRQFTHPTPVEIMLAMHDVLDRENAIRAKQGRPMTDYRIPGMLREAVRLACERHDKEAGQ